MNEYKSGDKVKIKKISPRKFYTAQTLEILKKYNYILTIRTIFKDTEFEEWTCLMSEALHCNWKKDYIECLASEYKEPEPIYSRFEILDL